MKFFLLSVFISIAFFFQSAQAQWIRDTTIFANSFGYHNGITFLGKDGVSRSLNNGASWNRSDSGFSQMWTERQVNCFVTINNSVIAGVMTHSIYKTTNDGLNWIRSAAGITSGATVNCLMKKDSVVYAGTNDGIFYSTNDGNSWAVCSILMYNKNVIAINYIGSRLIASVQPDAIEEGIYLSTNNGANWYKSITGLNSFATLYSIAVHRNNLVFASSTDGIIYKSTNQGNSWIQTHSETVLGNFYNPVYALASFNLSLIAGCNNGIFMSTNAGVNWFNFYFGVPEPGSQFQKDAIIKCGSTVFAAGNNGTYRIPYSSVSIQQISSSIPDKFELKQNYPNPFNPTTKINFLIPQSSFIQLKVFDISGREVKELYKGNVTAGEYSVNFDASGLTSGVYFYTLSGSNGADQFSVTKKMLLVK